jgi:two-component system, cell cycle response regulator DivK
MLQKRILLVEDDPLSLKLMRDVLRAHGYETDEVSNGLEVMDRAIACSADLVVMDIGLPGLDGREATRQMKAAPATRDIPVVVVTAFAMQGDEERMREAGCDAYLAKPLRFSELVDVVNGLLAVPG